jgi:hypothetical protein
MDATKAMVSGLAGAAALNVIHESARALIPHAPRVDVIGRRALAKSYRALGHMPPEDPALYYRTMVADVASNAAYYAMVGAGDPRNAIRRGLALGALAGLGAVVLPQRMGLGRQPGQRTPWTELMTVGWYTLGGVVAGVVATALDQEPATAAAGQRRRRA